MEVSKEGALAMGRDSFIASMLRLNSIKTMGEAAGKKYLNKMYDGFEAIERKNTGDRPKKSVSRVRRR